MAVARDRKRHLSLPAVGESEVKKIRSDMNSKPNEETHYASDAGTTWEDATEVTTRCDRTLRNVVRARRNFLGKKSNDNET